MDLDDALSETDGRHVASFHARLSSSRELYMKVSRDAFGAEHEQVARNFLRAYVDFHVQNDTNYVRGRLRTLHIVPVETRVVDTDAEQPYVSSWVLRVLQPLLVNGLETLRIGCYLKCDHLCMPLNPLDLLPLADCAKFRVLDILSRVVCDRFHTTMLLERLCNLPVSVGLKVRELHVPARMRDEVVDLLEAIMPNCEDLYIREVYRFGITDFMMERGAPARVGLKRLHCTDQGNAVYADNLHPWIYRVPSLEELRFCGLGSGDGACDLDIAVCPRFTAERRADGADCVRKLLALLRPVDVRIKYSVIFIECAQNDDCNAWQAVLSGFPMLEHGHRLQALDIPISLRFMQDHMGSCEAYGAAFRDLLRPLLAFLSDARKHKELGMDMRVSWATYQLPLSAPTISAAFVSQLLLDACDIIKPVKLGIHAEQEMAELFIELVRGLECKDAGKEAPMEIDMQIVKKTDRVAINTKLRTMGYAPKERKEEFTFARVRVSLEVAVRSNVIRYHYYTLAY